MKSHWCPVCHRKKVFYNTFSGVRPVYLCSSCRGEFTKQQLKEYYNAMGWDYAR